MSEVDESLLSGRTSQAARKKLAHCCLFHDHPNSPGPRLWCCRRLSGRPCPGRRVRRTVRDHRRHLELWDVRCIVWFVGRSFGCRASVCVFLGLQSRYPESFSGFGGFWMVLCQRILKPASPKVGAIEVCGTQLFAATRVAMVEGIVIATRLLKMGRL